jgi:hypothetical protein
VAVPTAPTPRSPAPARLALPLAALLLSAAPAAAYDEPTHELLTARAFPEVAGGGLAPATAADLLALRRAVWQAGAGHPDAEVRRRFLARFPEEAGFDAWSLKALAGLAPEATVIGLDVPPAPELEPRRIAALASRDPDQDRRNQARYAHAPDRSVRRDAWGRPLPADPAQLQMGNLSGLSSQAHAHYGLPRLARSDDPEVLKRDPRRFSVPPDALTFAADFAQLQTDLALGAASLGTPGGRQLGWALLGQGEHYLEDVANQVHTLQAVYPFFVSAKLESLQEDLFTLGGLLGPRRGFIPIGIHVISNHHLFAEALWSSRVVAASRGQDASGAGQAGLAAIAAGDPAFEATLDGAGLGPSGPFAASIAEALEEASSLEGGEVYLTAREVARRRLSTRGYEFPDGGDAVAELDPAAPPAALARFFELERRGFARAGSAVRRHVRLYRAALAEAGDGEAGRQALRQAALGRFVARALDAQEAREARLAAWTPAPPARTTISWGWPGGLAALLLAAAWLVRRRLRTRRARLRGTAAA